MRVFCGGFEIGRDRLEDCGQLRGLIEPAQDAMTSRGVGDVNKPPLTDLHPMSAMLADDARIVAVRAIVFRVNRPMEDRSDEFAVAPVDRGSARTVANLKRERFIQFKAAGESLRNGEVQFRSVASSVLGRYATTPVEMHEITERFLSIDGKSVEQCREVDRRRFGTC